MIQLNTDNYGTLGISQENPLELVTQSMAFGTPQISGWYCHDLTQEELAPYSHFLIVEMDDFNKATENKDFINLIPTSMTCWITYKAEPMPGRDMMIPKMHWLYAFTTDLALQQFKQLLM